MAHLPNRKRWNTAALTALAFAVATALAPQASGQAPSRSAPPCDRDCLIRLADTYVAALVAHDPKKVPLGAGVVTVENLKRIKPGEGMWASIAGAPGDFVIRVPDPTSQQVGTMVVLQGTDGKPILVGIRLKLVGGKIVEAEHLSGNPLADAQIANLRHPRAPLLAKVAPEYGDSRGRLIAIGKSYYDSIDNNNGALAPYADDCVRLENGFQTARTNPGQPVLTPNRDESFAKLAALGCRAQMDTGMWAYIDTIDNRRVEIADVETGLVWGMSQFHHDMKEKAIPIYGVQGVPERDMSRFTRPIDVPAVHIYKIWSGQIHEIEAIGRTMDYQGPSGWGQ
jgi:hypothetical protein